MDKLTRSERKLLALLDQGATLMCRLNIREKAWVYGGPVEWPRTDVSFSVFRRVRHAGYVAVSERVNAEDSKYALTPSGVAALEGESEENG